MLFLVCWFENGYKSDQLQLDVARDVDQVDILTRLERRTFTRHLARYILSMVTEQDLVVMAMVSRSWRVFLMRELRSQPQLFSKIRHLQIVESKKRMIL